MSVSGYEIFCYDPEVMGSNPGQVELEVHNPSDNVWPEPKIWMKNNTLQVFR